ncbi:MAG TPA: hypothetical protein VFN26_11710 [Candidatus Acidoferrum sp.]|nr:hypothetical protein [Candidatus Acidoferrum sp.]
MRRIFGCFIFLAVFLRVQGNAQAQNIVVPAGTLLHCTLDEPNFSSAIADIGDPVVCHLNGLREFGQNVFPRGSYLGGHLEADKEPGHFVGKGYLKIEFDRIGFPTTDIPVPSKLIAAKGYKVDKKGDIVGKGHPKRDVVEWMIPPLWPWKIIMLPARGPRPALKGESQITLRLMDDIEVPRIGAAYHSYDRPASYERRPATYRPQSFDGPRAPEKPVEDPADTYVATNTEATESTTATMPKPMRVKRIALKSENVYEVTRYRISGGSVSYVLASGATGSVDATEVDWRATSRMNAEPMVSAVAGNYQP